MCEDVVYLLIVLRAKILEFIVYCVFVCWIVSIEKGIRYLKLTFYILLILLLLLQMLMFACVCQGGCGCGCVGFCSYHIISNFISISYKKTNKHKKKKKNTTWYWGHDLKAKKAWDNLALNKGFIKYTDTFKTKKLLCLSIITLCQLVIIAVINFLCF